MKVRIDADKCQGHMTCVALCPDVFLVDKDGYSYTNDADTVAPEYHDLVRQAAMACPAAAITIEE